ncbi:MAG: hypothetical protein HY925_09415 [Elusimicrobia bacterium]|nr:hypothetical protein [Elusimicrobiota bacterium]
MNSRQRAVLSALLPGGADPRLPVGLLESGFEEFYASFRAEAGPEMRVGFSAALWAAIWLAPLLIGKLPPITLLSPENRERALEAMLASRVYALRQLGLVLKAVASFHYGVDPRVRRAIGFPG